MHLFISYPDKNEDITLNLRSRLEALDVNVWAFSHDRTLAQDSWNEIEAKLMASKAVLFMASEHSKTAEGQKRELGLALEKLSSSNLPPIFPVVLDNFKFSDLPEPIRHINGEKLSASNVKTVALRIASHFFPENFSAAKHPWRIPPAGAWLKVSMLDSWIEQYFELEDLLYFRMVDPLGLLECYSPKLRDLFWISPDNVKPANLPDEDGSIERDQVPYEFQITTMYHMLREGFQKLKKEKNIG